MEICSSVRSQDLSVKSMLFRENTHEKNFIDNLKRIWCQYKKCEALIVMLNDCFEKAENPYLTCLSLVLNSPDYSHSRPSSLTFNILDIFSHWLKKCCDDRRYLLTKSLKEVTFKVISGQKNRSIYIIATNVYRLVEDKELFLEPLKHMLKQHLYKEVCEWVVILDLKDKFNIYDFLVPLTLQDKVGVVDQFLKESPEHQIIFIGFLDDLLVQKSLGNYLDKLVCDLNMPEIPRKILCKMFLPKVISKYIKRLSTMFNISPESFPNYNKRQGTASVGYFVHKRYFEKALSHESFRELIIEIVGSDSVLVEELIDRLVQAGENREALHWCQHFSIPISSVPYSVQAALETSHNGEVEEDWDETDSYHTLNLPQSSVYLIDSEVKFSSVLETLSQSQMVAFDSEWRPNVAGGKQELSLIQFATKKSVFILDVLALAPYKHLWDQIITNVFNNEDVLKLGFAIMSDMAMLTQFLELELTVVGSRILDISDLWSKLSTEFNIEFPFSSDAEKGNSLSHLIFLCLGKYLNKCEQFSAWNSRPLRESQITYAALDAFCLLEVFEVLKHLCQRKEIPFEDIVNEVVQSYTDKSVKTDRKKKKKKVYEEVWPVESFNQDPVGVDWLRVVCDSMVKGLGKRLRRCGVDTVFLPDCHAHSSCAQISKSEDRIIITGGNVYKTLCRLVPPGKCYCIKTYTPEDQLIEVLNFFNVIVKEEDIFSRCMACNSKEMSVVSSDTVTSWFDTQTKQAVTTSMGSISVLPAGFEDTFDCDDDEFYDDYFPVQSTSVSSVIHPRTKFGTRIQVNTVPTNIIDKVRQFHLCESCGKIFWKEGQFDQFLGNLNPSFIAQE